MFGPLRINFEEIGVAFDVGPAFPDLNPLYRAAAMAFVKPYTLSSQLGRLSEERSAELLASAYAEGVIFHSDPDMSRPEIRAWLIKHPEEFTIIRSYAEHRANFEDTNGTNQQAGGQAQEGSGASDEGV